MDLDLEQALTEAGPAKVYAAACAAQDGDFRKLNALGLPVGAMADVWRIMSAAYKRMSAREREADGVPANA